MALQFGLLFKINNDNKAILKNPPIQVLRLLNLDTNDPNLDSPINWKGTGFWSQDRGFESLRPSHKLIIEMSFFN